MENRFNLVVLITTLILIIGLVSAAKNDDIKVLNEKKNPIINLFEAPLKAFQTKPGEAIAVFQPEIVRQAEAGENINGTNSWFQAGQSLGSQVSSLTGWLTNRLYANQQSSTTQKPDPDVLVQVQQIKPESSNNGNGIGNGNGNRGGNKPIRNMIRFRPNNNIVRRRPFINNINNAPVLDSDELDDEIDDLDEQQRIENDQFDDAEEEYEDNLQALEDQNDFETHHNNIGQIQNGNQNRNRLRNGNMNRIQNNQNRNRNQRRRRPQRKQPQNNNRYSNRRPPMQPQNNNNNNNRNNNNNGSKRDFGDRSRYSDDDEDLDDDDDYDEDDDDDDYEEENNSSSSSSSSSSSKKKVNSPYDEEYLDYTGSKDKYSTNNRGGYDDDVFVDLQQYDPVRISSGQSNDGYSQFIPLDFAPLGGNGNADRLIQINQPHYPSTVINRREQLLVQQEKKKKREREQQELQQALLNNQHIIIPIHFIPDSIPYPEIAPQVVPQAQIQVVAQHHHTVQNTAPASTIVVQEPNPVRHQNKNKYQNSNNRKPISHRNQILLVNSNRSQNKKKKQNQRVKKITTSKPEKEDDIYYSVNLIAPASATGNRPNVVATRSTRRPPTKKISVRPTPTVRKEENDADEFRGQQLMQSAVVMQDKNRPDALPKVENEEINEQETPPLYISPMASSSIADDDEEDAKAQARTQFYLPQRYYQILGSDKYLAVGNNGRFLLKSARSLDLSKSEPSNIENSTATVENLDKKENSNAEHPAKIVETTKEKLSQESSTSVPVDKVKQAVESNKVEIKANEEKVEKKVEESTVAPTILKEIPQNKEEESKSVENVQASGEDKKDVIDKEKEVDDGSISTTTERPFIPTDKVNEELSSTTVAPVVVTPSPLNKASKVLLRSEIVQEKQNGGRFLVKSEQVKN